MDRAVRPSRRAAAVLVALSLSSIGWLGSPSAAPTLQLPAIVDPGLLGLDGTVPVVVQERDASTRSAEDAVVRLGGTLERDLSIVDGFSGTIPASAVDDLARVAAVRGITLDRVVRLMDAPHRAGSQSVYRQVVRADDAEAGGATGAGVTVALIDTGVASVAKLSGRIKTVTNPATGLPGSCANFSGESGCGDSYGHGTFVAGVIAGSAPRKGVAPGSQIVSVKLAGADGASDVSTLLAALQWIVSFKDTYGIDVINLSLGTDSPQPYAVDPLNYAVEKAWNAGIVVVVAAGNLGPNPASVTKPADDPWVITVGAIDDLGTEQLGDDVLPDFTSRGPTLSDSIEKPDLVAPGAHIVSLRAPGSSVDTRFPTYVDNHYRRASGTSFSAPQVTGAIALMLQRTPAMTPNQVKYALLETARETTSGDWNEVGAGVLDAYAAAFAPPSGQANQGLAQSDGSGSLHASRGSLLFEGDVLPPILVEGLLTQQLRLFDPIAYSTTGWTPSTWFESQWSGAKWYGAKWYEANPFGAKWYGAKWYGAKWYGAKWYEAGGEEPSYGTPYLGGAIYGAWE